MRWSGAEKEELFQNCYQFRGQANLKSTLKNHKYKKTDKAKRIGKLTRGISRGKRSQALKTSVSSIADVSSCRIDKGDSAGSG